ncbi:MAG: hypothetical protein K2L08_04930 [Erysipelotrichaceae bacterium]|nr:hypothetical protein [Erysipelotrichaceae bacterium]
MSATSVKIYGNDMALDVKEDFLDLYGVGKSIEEINQYILAYRPNDEDEDACAFWSALAFIQWEYGVLTSAIKEKAEEVIQNHSDAYLFFEKKLQEKRVEELQTLIKKLNTINQNPKKRKKTFVYQTNWKQGDILAVPVLNKFAYLHICGVERKRHKISELESDQVFVQVFDELSDNVLTIQDFESKLSLKNQYMILDRFTKSTVKALWCVGIRERNALEKKAIFIGNLPIKYQTSKSVYVDFQFCEIENTLATLFNL